jgi:hypothetical protein
MSLFARFAVDRVLLVSVSDSCDDTFPDPEGVWRSPFESHSDAQPLRKYLYTDRPHAAFAAIIPISSSALHES